jgi:hypothetical protein
MDEAELEKIEAAPLSTPFTVAQWAAWFGLILKRDIKKKEAGVALEQLRARSGKDGQAWQSLKAFKTTSGG